MTVSVPLPFREAIGRALDERRANGGSLAVLHVDCGVIGRIDAVWGYQLGDAVRARLMASLRSDVLRPDDLIGELDRDGFACVLSVIEGPAVAYLAAQKILRALNVPLWVGDDEISANPAVGISLFPNNGSETDSLLQRAKNAALVSRSAPGRIAEYDEGVADPVAAQLLAENRLRDAIREDGLHAPTVRRPPNPGQPGWDTPDPRIGEAGMAVEPRSREEHEGRSPRERSRRVGYAIARRCPLSPRCSS